MDKSTLADIEQRVEVLEALAISRFRCEEYRRRFEEDGVPISTNEAVNAYGFVPRLLEIEPRPAEDIAYLASREPQIRAIVEGFEREIAEDLQTLYLLHIGEAKARKVGPWERFLAYITLKYFVGVVVAFARITGRTMADELQDLVERAQAILNARTVNKPRGRHDPRSNGIRDSSFVVFLRSLEGYGLDVTSLDGASLAGAMSEATGIPKRTISRVREEAPSWLRGDKRSRKRFAYVPCARCGSLKVPTWRARRGDNPLCDQCSLALGF